MTRQIAAGIGIVWMLSAQMGCVAEDMAAQPGCTACGGKEDGTNPGGSSGLLTIHLPAGVEPQPISVRNVMGGPHLPLFVSGEGRALSPGRYCVYTARTKDDCNVVVEGGARVTYNMGSVTFVRGRPDLVVGIDGWTLEIGLWADKLLSRTGAIPHPMGEFSYEYGRGMGRNVSFRVAAAANTIVDLTDTTDRRAIRLLPSVGRTLPDSAPSEIQICLDGSGVSRQCYSHFNPDKPTLFFAAEGEERLSYTWRNSGFLTQFKFGAVGAPVEVQLRRLDLNHVRVTMPDNSVKVVPGTAYVNSVIPGGGVSGFYIEEPTGVGFDLPPSAYRVTTKYTHPADGQPWETTEIVDLR